ncbi:hypothetical protein PABG_11254 [Paracoccidioides brasiliensis Pb03]|nr:hypothetical protein PABG_11254 [Paracoccidioides brasiliensis Pb03]
MLVIFFGAKKASTYAFADTDEESYNQDVSFLINTQTKVITHGTQTKLLTMTAQKVYRNPSLASVIAGLHHGSYKTVDTSDLSGAPVVDTQGIKVILALLAKILMKSRTEGREQKGDLDLMSTTVATVTQDVFSSVI